MENKEFILPIVVISPTDIARLIREINNLDEFLRQTEIRKGTAPQESPRYSRLLDEVVQANGLNLLESNGRQSLIKQLESLDSVAPVMHISFSADPPGSYVQKIVGWLRQNVHGLILVQVGLQPNIGAGCVVRTTNKQFDFSLRSYFQSKHESFMKRLHEAVAIKEEESVEATLLDPAEQNQQIGTTNVENSDQPPEVLVEQTAPEPSSILPVDSKQRPVPETAEPVQEQKTTGNPIAPQTSEATRIEVKDDPEAGVES